VNCIIFIYNLYQIVKKQKLDILCLTNGLFRFNDTDIKKLKLNKSQKLDALDYN
jgi:hypothetical protein